VNPALQNTTPTFLYSPASGSGSELAPQLIGTWSGQLSGVTRLDFIDWPATIGIDNLVVDPVPEPSTLLLTGSALASGLVWLRSRRRRAP
jgi:PEP-CTERM motif